MENELGTLENSDFDDIEDVVRMIEKSFGFKFDRKYPISPATFGELCDAIESRVTGIHDEKCTSQQAFYKIREAISAIQDIDKKTILPSTRLSYLFPRKYRRQLVSSFEQQLGFRFRFLTIESYISLPLFFVLFASLIAFFFSTQVALTGLMFSIGGFWIAARFSQELQVETVGELTTKMMQSHYMSVRRLPGSVNKNEIRPLIRQLFAQHLGLNPESLTDNAKLG